MELNGFTKTILPLQALEKLPNELLVALDKVALLLDGDECDCIIRQIGKNNKKRATIIRSLFYFRCFIARCHSFIIPFRSLCVLIVGQGMRKS